MCMHNLRANGCPITINEAKQVIGTTLHSNYCFKILLYKLIEAFTIITILTVDQIFLYASSAVSEIFTEN